MPAPRWLARFNRRVTNRLTRRVAPHLPGFGVVVHRGRKTQRRYRTPVNVFRRDSGYVIALTYGSDAEWVQNVLVAGGCTVETRGRSLRLTQPRLVHDPQQLAMPAPIRPILGLLHVTEFLTLTLDEAAGEAVGAPA